MPPAPPLQPLSTHPPHVPTHPRPPAYPVPPPSISLHSFEQTRLNCPCQDSSPFAHMEGLSTPPLCPFVPAGQSYLPVYISFDNSPLYPLLRTMLSLPPRTPPQPVLEVPLCSPFCVRDCVYFPTLSHAWAALSHACAALFASGNYTILPERLDALTCCPNPQAVRGPQFRFNDSRKRKLPRPPGRASSKRSA